MVEKKRIKRKRVKKSSEITVATVRAKKEKRPEFYSYQFRLEYCLRIISLPCTSRIEQSCALIVELFASVSLVHCNTSFSPTYIFLSAHPYSCNCPIYLHVCVSGCLLCHTISTRLCESVYLGFHTYSSTKITCLSCELLDTLIFTSSSLK